MKAFAGAWPDEPLLQRPAAKVSWFHNCIILDKIKDRAERLWYIQAAIEHGWSRNVLVIQIEAGLYRRQRKAVTNFTQVAIVQTAAMTSPSSLILDKTDCYRL
jgi:hypothetical protein